MAAQITVMLRESGQSLTTAHTCVARGGEPMFRICKGVDTNAYQASIFEARALTRLAKESTSQLTYDAIILTHGETDAILRNNEYNTQLLAFHDDYVKDLLAITGQGHKPIILPSQQHTCPADPEDLRHSPVTQAQWRSQAKSANQIICAGPKYQYGYHLDGLHFTAPSYDRLGEKYRQAPHQDSHTMWSRGRGFEIQDNLGCSLDIDNVSINTAAAAVSIKLAFVPLNIPLKVTYAVVAYGSGCNGGRPGGRGGQLCDSDPTIGASAEIVSVEAVHGDNRICCTDEHAFDKRVLHDLVTPGMYTIVAFDEIRDPQSALLDTPWEGVSGRHELFMHYNHRNYCVAFAAIVDETFSSFDADLKPVEATSVMP